MAYEVLKHFKNQAVPKNDGTHRGPRKSFMLMVEKAPVRVTYLSPLRMRFHLMSLERFGDALLKLA